MRTGLVIVAAGESRRMNNRDKVWSILGNRPVVAHATHALVPHVDVAVLVVRSDCMERARATFATDFPALMVVQGGPRRIDSVSLGLSSLDGVDAVAVHDAARPFASRHLLQTGFGLLDQFDAAIPVQPLYDTVKEINEEGSVRRTLDRSRLFAAQTPQHFRIEPLRDVHSTARNSGSTATDDALLLEAAGYDVHAFPGSPSNFKITTGFDLDVARLVLAEGIVT